jgi:hypothetical protein
MSFESHALRLRQLTVDVCGHPDARPTVVPPVAYSAHAVLATSRLSRLRVRPAAATPSSTTLITCELLRPATAALEEVDRSQPPPFRSFAEGVRQWRDELLAYFDEPTTNGYAEGVINKVKVIKRRAYGLTTFDGFRERVLVACG